MARTRKIKGKASHKRLETAKRDAYNDLHSKTKRNEILHLSHTTYKQDEETGVYTVTQNGVAEKFR
jgi:hypothetical protein